MTKQNNESGSSRSGSESSYKDELSSFFEDEMDEFNSENFESSEFSDDEPPKKKQKK